MTEYEKFHNVSSTFSSLRNQIAYTVKGKWWLPSHMMLLLTIATNFQYAFMKKHKYNIVAISVRIYEVFPNLEGELTAVLTLYLTLSVSLWSTIAGFLCICCVNVIFLKKLES